MAWDCGRMRSSARGVKRPEISVPPIVMVRSRPTTATNANIFARLPGGTPVQVVGEFQTWYVIEQPGSTGFVAKRYITLLP